MSARLPTPYQTACSLLIATGAGVLLLNRRDPDESWLFGAGLLVLGAACLAAGERAWRWRVVQALLVLVLVCAGGEWRVHRLDLLALGAQTLPLLRLVPDPELRYEMVPAMQRGEGMTNARGMMDVPRRLNRAAGTLRVACLGDSVGADFSLPRDNTCAALERLLSGERKAEVLNFSVPGYDTLQQARALEVKATPFGFDAVVVLFTVSDPDPDVALLGKVPGKVRFEHRIYSAIRARLAPNLTDRFGVRLKSPFSPKAALDDRVVRGFERIAKAAKARNAPVVVVVFPVLVSETVERYGALYAKVVAEAERHGFRALDLSRTAFADRPMSEFQRSDKDPIHPNATGHRTAAKAVAQVLRPLLGAPP